MDVVDSPGQKHSWFLDQLRMLQVPHGAGMEAMRIEVKPTYRTTSFCFWGLFVDLASQYITFDNV